MTHAYWCVLSSVILPPSLCDVGKSQRSDGLEEHRRSAMSPVVPNKLVGVGLPLAMSTSTTDTLLDDSEKLLSQTREYSVHACLRALIGFRDVVCAVTL